MDPLENLFAPKKLSRCSFLIENIDFLFISIPARKIRWKFDELCSFFSFFSLFSPPALPKYLYNWITVAVSSNSRPNLQFPNLHRQPQTKIVYAQGGTNVTKFPLVNCLRRQLFAGLLRTSKVEQGKKIRKRKEIRKTGNSCVVHVGSESHHRQPNHNLNRILNEATLKFIPPKWKEKKTRNE